MLKNGQVGAILPSAAAIELPTAAVMEIRPGWLSGFDREMHLAWNPRLAGIRKVVERAVRTMPEIIRMED